MIEETFPKQLLSKLYHSGSRPIACKEFPSWLRTMSTSRIPFRIPVDLILFLVLSSLLGGCAPPWQQSNLNAPQNVIAESGNHSITVKWQAPDNGVPTLYKIISIASQEGHNTVVGTVPGKDTSYQVLHLYNCQRTRWVVVAIDAQGNVSKPSNTSNEAWTYGPPPTSPSKVVIFADGVGSYLPSAGYSPMKDVSTYCSYTGKTTNFPDPLAHMITLFQGDPPTSPGYGSRLTDTLAGGDAVLLPFSYTKAAFFHTQYDPSVGFQVLSYNSDDVANTDPQTASDTMDAEIRSIHYLLPDAQIFIIGHSNGGLVAEDWWIFHGRHDPQGVAHIWSLDSPLNGVANAGACALGVCGLAGVGSTLGTVYTALWQHQAELEPKYLSVDADGIFTPIGTIGDPVFKTIGGAPLDGLISQLYFNEPDCAKSNFDQAVCKPQGSSKISPCKVSDNGPIGLSGHVLVENCPGVLDSINNVINPPANSPTNSPTDSSLGTIDLTFSGAVTYHMKIYMFKKAGLPNMDCSTDGPGYLLDVGDTQYGFNFNIKQYVGPATYSGGSDGQTVADLSSFAASGTNTQWVYGFGFVKYYNLGFRVTVNSDTKSGTLDIDLAGSTTNIYGTLVNVTGTWKCPS